MRNKLGNDDATSAPVNLVSSILYVLGLWRPHWRQAVLILSLMSFYLLFKTYFAFMLKTVIDSLQAAGQVINLWGILITLVIGSILSFGGRLIVEKRIAYIGATILNDLRIRMFKHLQQLSHGFYQRTPIGLSLIHI